MGLCSAPLSGPKVPPPWDGVGDRDWDGVRDGDGDKNAFGDGTGTGMGMGRKERGGCTPKPPIGSSQKQFVG